MKKTFALLAASVVVGGCLLVSLEGDSVNKVVYLEEFDHYAYHVDGFKPGTKCVEWATGSLKGLGFAPEAEGLSREGFFPIVESPKGKWTLTFLAWKQQKAPSPFSLVLYYGDRQSPKTVEHPFVASNEWWQTCAVFSENNDTLVGWNLKGGTNTNVFIDRVRVEQGVHRPYRLGDPAEWIAAAKPVVDEKLPEDLGVALEPKKPVAVDLEKEDLLFKYKPTGKDEIVFGCGGRRGDARSRGTRDPTDGRRVDARLARGASPTDDVRLARGASPTGGAYELRFGLGDEVFQSYQTLDGKPLVLKNEYVTIRPTRMDRFPKIYSRPCVFLRYQKPEMAQVLAAREKFPAPTNRVFDVRVTRNERGENELYVDGNFALFFTNAPVVAVSGTPSFRMKTAPRPADSLVRKLDFRQWPNGFPLWNVRENRGGCWIGILDYCCRSAFEASPSSCLFSVPNRPYVKARALCRVATDVPVDFEPVVVARLTSYYKKSHGDAGGRSADACAKAEVRLPRPGSNGPLPKGVVKKGENLYEVTFDLDIGQMQDLLYRGDAQMAGVSRPDQLDLEFTGILWRQDTAYVDRSSVPDCDAQSSVVVLSGELEAAPCDFDVVPFHPYSVYFPEETAGGKYMIRPRQPGKYAIEWTVADEKGAIVDKGSVQNAHFTEMRPRDAVRDAHFTEMRPRDAAAGSGCSSVNCTETEKRPQSRGCSSVNCTEGDIHFKIHEVGYYKVRYSFTKDGAELWHHDAAFVVVPTDDRQAGYESPYAAWLWCGIHGTNPDLEGEMEVFKRLGIRKTMLTEYARRAETNDLCRAYRLGLGEFPWRGFQIRKGETFDQAVERQAKANRKLVAEYPHCKRALIFHESGNGPFPMELVGGKTELTEKDREKDLRNVERARGAALAWRKADPSVKLVMGNSVESYGLLAGLFRSGFPKDLVDYVGEESVGYSTTPEESSARVPWIQREIARLYGYEAKSECPFEWKCRAPRLFEDPGYLLTAFHLRDLLISHALGYSFISAGGTKSGTSDGYVQSCWSSRADERWPLAYPARDTVATAVLTSILDCGKFKRLVPTGSLGVYCEEFEVKGKYVYALWTTRGEVEMTIDFGKDAHFTEMRPRDAARDAHFTEMRPRDAAAVSGCSSVNCTEKKMRPRDAARDAHFAEMRPREKVRDAHFTEMRPRDAVAVSGCSSVNCTEKKMRPRDAARDAHFTEMRPRDAVAVSGCSSAVAVSGCSSVNCTETEKSPQEKDVGAVPRTAPGECVLVSATGHRRAFPLFTSTSTSHLHLLPVSDEPQYLVCAKPIAGAKAALQRRYPREEVAFANRAVAVPLVSADEVVVSDQPERKFFWEGDKFLRRSPFAAKTANDPVKGACVELRDLSGTEKTPKTVANCTVLRFPKAQPVPGEFDSIGVWVEGNMNGGKIQFEITDAEGEVWATTGSAGYGVPSYDWPDAMSVNFDGWHFLKFPLTRLSPVKNGTCGRDFFQVTRDGNGNGKIDFPVKVTALAVGNRPWNLDFLEMRPTRPFIQLKDVTLLKGAAR